MKKIFYIILFICLSFFLTQPLISAKKNVKGSISAGAYLQGDNDALDRAAEYSEDKSSPSFKAIIETFNSSSDFSLEGNYIGQYDNDLNVKANVKRLLSIDLNYQGLYHRKDYDTLFKEYDKTNFSTAVAKGLVPLSNTPDGKVYGVNPFMYDNLTGSPGAQWFEFEQDQTAVDKDYYIKRREVKGKLVLSVPTMETLKFNFAGRVENRKGYEHKTAMVGKCTICHVRGLRKKINETTRDLSAGVSFTGGPLYLSYNHMRRDFYVTNGLVTTKFDSVEGLKASKPDKYALFSPRLNSETYGTTAPVSLTPESKKDMDTFKLRLDLPYYSSLAASYTHSGITNNDGYDGNSIDLDQDAMNLRLTGHFLNRKLSLSAKFRYVSLDRDNINAELEKNEAYFFQPGQAAINVPGQGVINYDFTKTYFYNNTGQPVIFDVEGESTYDRDQYLFGFNVVYRILNNKLKFRGGYEYEKIERDHYYVYPGDKDTERNTVKLGVDFRPMNKFSGKFKFDYSNIDKPFAYPGSGCIQVTKTTDASLLYGGGGKAAYPLVYAKRNYTGSTSPSEIYDYSLNLNWNPSEKLSVSFLGKYTDSENDEGNTHWDYDAYMLGFDGNFIITEKLAFSFGYNYEKATTKSKLSVGLYAG